MQVRATDVTSRYKIARILRTKKASEIALALEPVYKKGGVLKYPKVFYYNNGSAFKSDVTRKYKKKT